MRVKAPVVESGAKAKQSEKIPDDGPTGAPEVIKSNIKLSKKIQRHKMKKA